jgi:hypothetical protein
VKSRQEALTTDTVVFSYLGFHIPKISLPVVQYGVKILNGKIAALNSL